MHTIYTRMQQQQQNNNNVYFMNMGDDNCSPGDGAKAGA